MSSDEIKIVTQMDRGLAYAEGCFETFRVVQGRIFQRRAHQRRLQQGLQSFGMHCPDAELDSWFRQAVCAVKDDDALVRMTVSGGDAAWGLVPDQRRPHVQIQMIRPPKRKTLHLQTVQWPFPLREKLVKYMADYAESLRAIQLWGLKEPMQALVCSEKLLLSTLTANIATYRAGQWWTPQGPGVLHGTVRRFLLQKGVMREAHCPIAWLADCEAMVCLNSGVFIQPVASVNGRSLATGHDVIKALYGALEGEGGVVKMEFGDA